MTISGKGLSGGSTCGLSTRGIVSLTRLKIFMVGNVALVRRNQRQRPLSTVWPASASASATPALPQWWRAWEITAANT